MILTAHLPIPVEQLVFVFVPDNCTNIRKVNYGFAGTYLEGFIPEKGPWSLKLNSNASGAIPLGRTSEVFPDQIIPHSGNFVLWNRV